MPANIDGRVSVDDILEGVFDGSDSVVCGTVTNSAVPCSAGPRPPPGLPAVGEVTAAMQARQWRDPEKWTMTMAQWHGLVDHCMNLPEYFATLAQKRYVSMYDICSSFVIPWTAGTGCGLSVLMSKDNEEAAKLMISHAWGEGVDELYRAMSDFFEQHRIEWETPVWFCVFANYQAQDGVGPSVPQQLAMNPFKAVIQSPKLLAKNGGHGMCAAHTTNEDLYTRLWCVHEVDAALSEDVEVRCAMSTEYVKDIARRVALFIEAGCSLTACERAAGIAVNTCKAKCGYPPDEKMLVNIVQQQQGGFDRLDAVIAKFRQAVLPAKVQSHLRAVAAMDELESASSNLREITSKRRYTKDELDDALMRVHSARGNCEQIISQTSGITAPRRYEQLLQDADVLVKCSDMFERKSSDDVADKASRFLSLPRRIQFTRMVERVLHSREDLRQLQYDTQGMKARVLRLAHAKETTPALKKQLDGMFTTLLSESTVVDILLTCGSEEERQSFWQATPRFYEGTENCFVLCRCGGASLIVGNDVGNTFLTETEQTRAAVAQGIECLASDCQVLFWVGPVGASTEATAKLVCNLVGRQSIVVNVALCEKDWWQRLCKKALLLFPPAVIIALDISCHPSSMAIAIQVAQSAQVPIFCLGIPGDGVDEAARLMPARARRMEFTRPSASVCVRWDLALRGYVACDTLALQLERFLDGATRRFSRHAFYDFGLRAAKALCDALPLRGCCTENIDEETVIFKTMVRDWFYPVLLPKDREVLNALMSECFGGEVPPLPESLRSWQGMLHSSLNSRHGSMIVPQRETDPEDVLVSLHELAQSPLELFRVPGTPADEHFLSRLELVGEKAVRHAKSWIVVILDDVQDSYETAWTEVFNPALDNNRVLCCSNNKVIHLNPGNKFIFVVPHADCGKYFSPAFISRVAIIAVG